MLIKRMVAGLLSTVLVASSLLQPLAVYAETVIVEQATAEASDVDGDGAEPAEVQEEGSPQPDAGEDQSGSSPVPANAVVDAPQDEATESVAADSDLSDEGTVPLDLSAVEFVYVDQSVVSVGDTQHIAIGVVSLGGTVTSATLELVDSQGQASFAEAENIVDASMLFSIAYTEDAQADAYQIASLSFTVDGDSNRYTIDLVPDSAESDPYAFDVVTGDLARALTADDGTEDGVTAYTVGEDGALEAASSVEDALATADASGVAESVESATAPMVSTSRARAAVSTTREDYLIVAVDPGHGGYDGGASGNGLLEKDVNWSIASSLKAELDTYTGVTAIMTRGQNDCPSLQARADTARAAGADVFVSVHCNSTGYGTAYGAEVWAPNNSSYYNEAHTIGTELGNKILAQLTNLGLTNRGVKFRDWGADDGSGSGLYADGSMADYYGVIRNCRRYNIPSIIVEHAFIDNAGDAGILASRQHELGVADATGIAQQYNLGLDSVARAQASVAVTSHVSQVGWEDTVYDQKVSGTTGKGLNLEAFRVGLLNGASAGSDIQYRATVDDSWQGWRNGSDSSAFAGTTGQNGSMEAIQIKLTGAAAERYDVYYRVHSAEVGWLGWARNGETAGTKGYGYAMQALEVVLVNKGSSAPGSTSNAYMDKTNARPALSYRAHVQDIGWQSDVASGSIAGTTAQSKHLEALEVTLDAGKEAGSDISIEAHVQDYGWQPAVSSGQVAGTTGQSKRLEAVKLSLTGSMQEAYDIYYRVHVSDVGWMNWAKNGEPAGTQGYGHGIEAIVIVLQKKGDANGAPDTVPPNTVDVAFMQKPVNVYATAHVADLGWMGEVAGGSSSLIGTTGRGLSIEALQFRLKDAVISGTIEARALNEDGVWSEWSSGQVGATGQSKQLEAIQLRLTEEMADAYDIYYRTHSADIGWQDWASNGESAGSEGYGSGLQAISVVLVKKGDPAPGSTDKPFSKALISYRAHVAEIGWQDYVGDGLLAGTTGQSLSLQALNVYLTDADGSVRVTAHVQDYGWMDSVEVSRTTYAGTVGGGKRMEAVCLELEGPAAAQYDIYYRAHVANIGWLDWAKNGARAGSQGFGYGIEALQICLVDKDGAAPGATDQAFRTPSDIMGASLATVDQLVNYYKSTEKRYPSEVYASKGAPTIEAFCQELDRAARAEGVRSDVVFCQAMKETGWLQFGGDVKPEQCNFAGLGAVGGGAAGCYFPDVYTGLLAQVQHLKAYASTAPLNEDCVDPRFHLVLRGVAAQLEQLNGRWAVPGIGYGEGILAMIGDSLTY